MREDFAAFLLVDEVKSPVTVQKMLARLDAARASGLDVAAFERGADESLRAGRAYLMRRRAGGPHAYNLDVRLLQQGGGDN